MANVINKKAKTDPYFAREKHKYVNPIPSREFIMEYLEEIGRPVTRSHLQTEFGIENEEMQEALRRRLKAMIRDGQLMKNRKGSYILVKQADLVCGRVVKYKEGFGFLVPDDGSNDIYLSAKEMRRIMPEDRVLVSVIETKRAKKREGVVAEILERGTKTVVGRYYEEKGIGFIAPLKKDIIEDILVPAGRNGNAKVGQIVVAEIVEYPTFRAQAIGQIIDILPEQKATGMEIEIAIRSYELPAQWSDEVKIELNTLPYEIGDDLRKQRANLQELAFVTIDGEDARDFDDAVYCVPGKNSGWILYVAIADVGHYVKSYTALDEAAKLRGNSVYFPEHVVPMLPEVLSNDLCSLKPNVERLAMVCEISVGGDGVIRKYRFYEAIIRSHARLTYNQVYAILEDKAGGGHPELHSHLRALYDIYQAFLKQRSKRGALEFKTVETKIIFDADYNIKNIEPVNTNYVYGIIEECMLAANVCTSKFLAEASIPALYRVHEEPDPEKVTNIRRFLKNRGLTLGGGAKPKPEHYRKLLTEIVGHADEHLIQEILLRSLRQAIYTPENIGHFGLAYKSYAHFTSPIRRYPDLVNHRAIRWLLQRGAVSEFIYDNKDMHNFGEHCSMTERRADKAVHGVINWLKCRFMQDKLGKVFAGVITNVTNFGVFVELKDIYVEGLLHITSLHNDYYRFDPITYSLHGKRSGVSYNLGDSISVLVARVDVDAHEIDFELME